MPRKHSAEAAQCQGCGLWSHLTPATPCLHPDYKPGQPCPGKKPKE